MLTRFYLKQEEILKSAINYFQNSRLQTIKIGLELEFFLFSRDEKPASDVEIADFIAEFQKNCDFTIERERGISQLEIKSDFTSDLSSLCQKLEDCKKLLVEIAQKQNLIVSFLAKPIKGDCASALQFNISLHDENGANLFVNQKELIRDFSNLLLSKTNEILAILAPSKDCYQRYDLAENVKLFEAGKFTSPVNLSYGFDNRTCAIRLKKNHIEYRAASALANSFLSIAAILLVLSGGEFGEEFIEIFGNAFDENYQLKPILKNQEEALKLFNSKGNMVREFFSNF